ncbi:MAG: helix-turn-helix transcriptional regulator [Bacteroidaceae bacterium]|nr:helix-turn-helix transcriptional regulator [Bacteroidaceae bacterium]
MLEFAIIEPNTLTSIGLEHLLEEVVPGLTIRVFHSFSEFVDDTPDLFAHCFVSSQIFFEHSTYFMARKHRPIVLSNGDLQPQLAGVFTLNINQDESHLAKSILKLLDHGHGPGEPKHAGPPPQMESTVLSLREIEVLRLVVQGYINKEIADKLNISLTTVITHRKNITEKLGIKSVSGLTIYAVMQGIVEADAI